VSAGYEDYYETTSPFDEEVETFKEHLRSAVKEEISAELTRLRTENGELKARLANLDTLEREAAEARMEYVRRLHNAEFTARHTVQKEALGKLLDLLDEPRYRIEMNWTMGPKCGKCDEGRHLHYTTPRGKAMTETCECAARTANYYVEEQLVHEVARRNGKVIAWYHSGMHYFEDGFNSPTVLKSADGVALEEMVKNPRDYGFATKEAAQVLADALNKEGEA
jgi:hypothetical protein